jgi:energy-coupling factor transport system ATP-binding protein
MTEPLIHIEGFSYAYPGAPEPALHGLDLELAEGEFAILAGRSGCGKSTLLRACCGLVPHYHGGEVHGTLEVCGLDVREHGPADLGGLVGLVGQEPETQVVSATVRGELELPLELRGESEAGRARAIEEVTLALGIEHLADRPTDSLSGGELQRVALAAALVLRPRLILLDEPTSQLDPVAGDELIGLLRRLNEEWGMGVLLAEHRLERCLAAADRVLALDRGRVQLDGSPASYCEWALRADPELATPGARLFSLARLSPPPVSVKEARRTLALAGIEPAADRREPEPAAPRRRRSRRGNSGALDVRDLWVELEDGGRPRQALRGLELAIEPGERVALMGRNGAGKSTLLRAVAGLAEPVRGSLSAPGGSVLLPQSPADLLVRERVADELPGEPGRRALETVDLAWAAESDPRDLSGGERERLALAIVMAGRADGRLPGLICLDEPTRGMDVARKRELCGWLGELADRGAAALVATHDVEFAARLASRVILLGDGELIADGPADEILSGGWYFATEVARILGAGGAITPEAGAELLNNSRQVLGFASGRAGAGPQDEELR